jgi:hypothetical protein
LRRALPLRQDHGMSNIGQEAPERNWVPSLPPAHPSRDQGIREARHVNRERRKQLREVRIGREVAEYGTTPLASVAATARYLGGVTTKTVFRLIERGDLEAIEIGSRVMVKTASAQRLAGTAK